MEEKNESRSIISIITNKKKNSEKKKEEKKSKDEEAVAKVQELLKNTPVAKIVGAVPDVEVKKDFDMETHREERTQKWLEDQVNELNRQVEEYENEILFYKEELRRRDEIINNGGVQNVVTQPNSPIDTSMNHTLITLFKHFENVYERGFTDAKLAHPESGNGILDLMQQYFPQLQQIRRYRYRGQ